MKSSPVLRVSLIVALFLTGCDKSKLKPKPPGSGGSQAAYFFENTEWTGVAGTYGQTYQQPCYLHFNGDTTVSVYALFSWVIGSDLLAIDSVIGHISAIDTTNGVAAISVNFPYTMDQQVYTITDKKTLKGGSIPASTALNTTSYTVQLQLCPTAIPTVAGTSWTTDINTDGGYLNGLPEFPDLSSLSFDANNKMSYYRNGQPVTYTPPTQDQLLIEGYTQIGPKLYFAGFNESADLLIEYFGVLSSDGETILADTRARAHARLPSYYETFHYYGQPGVTPNMHKVH